MSKRVIAVAGLAAALTFALGAPAASASSGPPPPVSTNGHKVELVASGLKTPTSFAFGDGMVFEGDGGNSEGNAPPNGGVYVLKNGAAVKIASPLKFVAGLAWHDNKLYISGAVLANGRPSWRLISWSGWNGTTFTVRKTLFIAKGSSTASTASASAPTAACMSAWTSASPTATTTARPLRRLTSTTS